MKKLDSLSYFPSAATLALSSAVVELLASESLIFFFVNFGAPNPRKDFGDGETNLTKLEDMIAQSSAKKTSLFWRSEKLHVAVFVSVLE